ncbi:retropepsin-like aspartic protease [Amphritea pacifica]|uniref:Clan AA aspartic protease n=1 Tax=Amphritea pacifica TaxID=2811233 RepID=A0ABS2WCV5_9GAMM|nr:retropepsin-like aspartic protease [Amphritea pacifica]MBN0989529.1 clan AA aspartic protease [Amphritea pacifica]
MYRSIRFLSILLWAAAALSSFASAEILHYIDASGRKVYVDSPHKIPPQFRHQSQQVETVRMTVEEQLASEQSRQQISEEYRRKQQIRELERTLANMTTPVRIMGNQVLVPVNVVWRGRKASLNLLLDTGASMTVLHRDGVSSLNTTSRDSSYAQVAGGGLIKTERVVFDRIELGPYRIENKSTAVIETSGPQPFDGLLGMDILGGGGYNIDFAQRKIVWAPGKYKEMSAALDQLKAVDSGVNVNDASGTSLDDLDAQNK